MPALLFGSIGTLVDTSELQRHAFNEAFAAHGLDWTWEQDDYRAMLDRSGGSDRVAAYARERGEDVDAAAVHATKSEVFRRRLREDAPPLRPGVREALDGAADRGLRLGLVTTTSPENVAAVLEATGLDAARFDVIVDADRVDAPKPDPAAYALALRELGEDPAGCVAIEDNAGGVQAAVAAGVPCVAFPGENNAGHDFSTAVRETDRLDLDEVAPQAARG